MFKKIETAITGCFELQPIVHFDPRGRFVKTYHTDYFASNNLETDFREQYYTISKKGVLRGMHFQNPPHEHTKLVCCTSGIILDVAIDLRVGSPSYLKHISLKLSEKSGNMLYLPAGLAHGYYSMTKATVAYNVSTVHVPEADTGILWNSIGMNWPDMSPITSERDTEFTTLENFQSPFKFT